MMPGSVAEAFQSAASQWADRPFLHILRETAGIYDIAAGPITYAAAAKAVAALRARYRAAGYGPSDRAGLMLENRPAFFLHWLALNALGVSVVPLNAELRAPELDYLVTHSEIALAVGTERHLPVLAAAAARTGRRFVVAADEAESVAGSPLPPARARRDTGAVRRMRAALHLRHDRAAEGLRAGQ